ncbi:MAG: GAF domain-containing protein [bacterium]
MAKDRRISGVSLLLAVVLLICGIIIVIYSDAVTMKVIGSLLAIGSVAYLISAYITSKKADNKETFSDYSSNSNEMGDSNQEKFEKFEDPTPQDLEDENENLESIKDIEIGEVTKKAEFTASMPKAREDYDEAEQSGIRIIASDKELRYSYGGGTMSSLDPKDMIKNEIVTTVRDVKSDEMTQIDLESDILFNEKDKLFGAEPRKEFDYFISKILLLIRTLTKTRTVVFALVDKKRNSFIIESFVTNKPDAINSKTEYEVSSDIISKVITGGETIVLSEINPSVELDLVPYYTKHLGTLSVIALPIIRWDGLVGVLCLDSSHAGAYTSNTPKLIEQFTGLLSAVISNYVNKFELVQAAKTLEAISLFQYKTISNNKDILKGITDTVAEIFEYDAFGICSYNHISDKWTINNVHAKEEFSFYDNIDFIDLKLSMLGNAILNHQKIYYELTENDKLKVFVKQGEPKFDNGSFVVVPISFDGNVYGAIFIINSHKNEYTDFEKGVLNTLSYHAGMAIDKLRLISILHNSAIIDPAIGVYNKIAFHYRLNHEVARSNDHKTNLIVCLFTIDKYTTVNWGDPEVSEMTNDNIIQIVRRKLRPYDVFGNSDDDTFGILLIDYTKPNAKIWAESLRKEIANSILSHNNNKFSVTISVGITDFKQSMTSKEFLTNAYSALKEASTKGNIVSSY